MVISEILNFRDVGEFVNLIAGNQLMHENRLLRGGKIDNLRSSGEIGYAKTIINLRNSPDTVQEANNLKYIHFPIANKTEKYNTQLPDVRQWLNDILGYLSENQLSFPVYIHCASGKDRTGIVIASLLWLLDIPVNVIKEEYLLSDGNISLDQIELTLEGFHRRKNYFNRISQENLKKNFLNPWKSIPH
jgi:protein-tyrosine phosphatase